MGKFSPWGSECYRIWKEGSLRKRVKQSSTIETVSWKVSMNLVEEFRNSDDHNLAAWFALGVSNMWLVELVIKLSHKETVDSLESLWKGSNKGALEKWNMACSQLHTQCQQPQKSYCGKWMMNDVSCSLCDVWFPKISSESEYPDNKYYDTFCFGCLMYPQQVSIHTQGWTWTAGPSVSISPVL